MPHSEKKYMKKLPLGGWGGFFFDFFHKHVLLRRSVLLTLTIALVVSVFQLSYKEDISDFMPLTDEEKLDMEIYQEISGVNKLVVLFSCDKAYASALDIVPSAE